MTRERIQQIRLGRAPKFCLWNGHKEKIVVYQESKHTDTIHKTRIQTKWTNAHHADSMWKMKIISEDATMRKKETNLKRWKQNWRLCLTGAKLTLDWGRWSKHWLACILEQQAKSSVAHCPHFVAPSMSHLQTTPVCPGNFHVPRAFLCGRHVFPPSWFNRDPCGDRECVVGVWDMRFLFPLSRQMNCGKIVTICHISAQRH